MDKFLDRDSWQDKIDKFKNRELKAKQIFDIRQIDKPLALEFIKEFHYLGEAKFFAVYCYGLFLKDTNCIVGAATFSNPQGIVAMKSWFGLDNQDQSVLELSRLCITPSLNGSNATSYLLGNSCKLLSKLGIRAVTTLADRSRHVGSIYQVCNFKYYGLSEYKTDFYCIDGRVNPRGQTKELKGVWLPRTQKHRYALILDNKLVCNYTEQAYPSKDETETSHCCDSTNVVFDKRFGEEYTCPKCTGKLEKINTI